MRNALSNAVGLLGGAAVVVGLWLVFMPVAVIVAGMFLVALAWRLQS